MKLRLQVTMATLTLAAWPAYAQPAAPAPSALETLGAMHHTGSAADWPEVPQTGAKADQVKKNLAKIKLPPGFQISLYALVPDARHIAVGPQGVATFVGTRKSKVWVVTDRARGGAGYEVKEFAPTLPKKIPNGDVSRKTASFTSSSRTGCWNIPQPNSSTRAPTSSPASSFPKAS
jgi:hypothetical protein